MNHFIDSPGEPRRRGQKRGKLLVLSRAFSFTRHELDFSAAVTSSTFPSYVSFPKPETCESYVNGIYSRIRARFRVPTMPHGYHYYCSYHDISDTIGPIPSRGSKRDTLSSALPARNVVESYDYCLLHRYYHVYQRIFRGPLSSSSPLRNAIGPGTIPPSP